MVVRNSGGFTLFCNRMASLNYRTAGESHGKALITLVEGMPAGVPLDK